MKKYIKPVAACTAAALALSVFASGAFAVTEDSPFGWYKDSRGCIYYYNESKQYLTGEQTVDGSKYLFSSNGVLKTGWRTVGGKRLYFDAKTGNPIFGWLDYCGKRYYIDSENGKAVGLFKDDQSSMYISDEYGAVIMQTGVYSYGGKKYYITDGKLSFGMINDGENSYYATSDGSLASGFTELSGKLYYFDNDTCAMLKNTRIDGYNINAEGEASPMTATQKKAAEIVSGTDGSAGAIYDYVTSHKRFKYIEETKTPAQINLVGWSSLAQFAMDNRYIVCYHFAALTDILFREAGYESRIVYGTGKGIGDHYWNQVKIGKNWLNYDTNNSGDNCRGVSDDYLIGLGYTYNYYITPDYSK